MTNKKIALVTGANKGMGWFGMFIGAFLGWAFAELSWRAMHPHGVITFGHPPTRGLDYWFIAALCSISGSAVGLAIARWRDLPNGDAEESPESTPN